jgi:ABC-type multidrug transport system fused ATPase/permease subunit
MHFQIEQLQEASAALARMGAVMAGTPEPLDDDPKPGSPPIRGIAVADLSYRHRGSAVDTLDRLNLRIAPGEHIAVVGPSGEGKTTLAWLLARLHETDRGVVLVDGEPAEAYPLGAYRRAVILVPHAVEVFSATVRDNVRLWDEAVSDKQIRGALAAAGLADTVEGLADGLDALLGTRGNPLSAGQRQRLGIARALLRGPDVLILDEATSALDGALEEAVLRNIRDVMRGRNLVLITHRENVAVRLDRVVRIENGRLARTNRAGAGQRRLWP